MYFNLEIFNAFSGQSFVLKFMTELYRRAVTRFRTELKKEFNAEVVDGSVTKGFSIQGELDQQHSDLNLEALNLLDVTESERSLLRKAATETFSKKIEGIIYEDFKEERARIKKVVSVEASVFNLTQQKVPEDLKFLTTLGSKFARPAHPP